MSSENNLDFFVTDNLNAEQLNSASQLFIENLSDNGFLALFGKKFIVQIFKDILSEKSGFFVLATHKTKVCGFALCTVKSELLFKLVYKKFFKYVIIILPQVIANPKLIPKIFETLFYVKNQNSEVKAEWVAGAIDTNYQSKGAGTQLVSALNKEFLKRGVHQYKVTVHDVKVKANNFHKKNGMKFHSSFNMYNLKWNLYIMQLN